jgi:hypothetical protein
MGEAWSMYERDDKYVQELTGKPEEKSHLEDLSIHGRTIKTDIQAKGYPYTMDS